MTTQMDPPDWLDLDIDDDECPNCDGGGWVESCHVDCCDCTNPPCNWSRCDYCNHDGRVSKVRPPLHSGVER